MVIRISEDVDKLKESNRIGYGFMIRNMNTGYIYLYWYENKDLAEQNLTIAELMSDEDNYDYDCFQDDANTILDTADGTMDEINWRTDIDYYIENGKKVYVYHSYLFPDDEYVELIDGKSWVDLYF